MLLSLTEPVISWLLEFRFLWIYPRFAKSPFDSFAIWIGQIYFVVWATYCIRRFLSMFMSLKPWIYNPQGTWIRLMASRPCCSYCTSLDHRHVKVLVEMLTSRDIRKCRSNLRYISDPTKINCARVYRSPCRRSDMRWLVSISTILSDDECTYLIIKKLFTFITDNGALVMYTYVVGRGCRVAVVKKYSITT